MIKPIAIDNDRMAEPVEAAGSETRGGLPWPRLEQMIADHPKQSVIAALVAGALLGWIIKRR